MITHYLGYITHKECVPFYTNIVDEETKQTLTVKLNSDGDLSFMSVNYLKCTQEEITFPSVSQSFINEAADVLVNLKENLTSLVKKPCKNCKFNNIGE